MRLRHLHALDRLDLTKRYDPNTGISRCLFRGVPPFYTPRISILRG